MKKYILTIITIIGATTWGLSQTGPGGVGAIDGTSSLDIWLRGDAGVETTIGIPATNNDNITFWKDQSGNGHDAQQTTTADKPTYNSTGMGGRPTLSFSSAGSQFLTVDYTFQEDFDVFVVASSTNTNWNNFGFLFSSRDNSGVIVHPRSGTRSMEFISYDNVGANST